MKKEARGERTPSDIILGSSLIRLDFNSPSHMLLFGSLSCSFTVLPPGGVQEDTITCQLLHIELSACQRRDEL